MATFPEGKLLKNGYKYQHVINVNRSGVETGPLKQKLNSPQIYLQFPVEYYFTKNEYIAFMNWVQNDIRFIRPFDWTDPVSENVISVRIVNGDIPKSEPINQLLTHWNVSFMIETI